jgi:hypothetical protein
MPTCFPPLHDAWILRCAQDDGQMGIARVILRIAKDSKIDILSPVV